MRPGSRARKTAPDSQQIAIPDGPYIGVESKRGTVLAADVFLSHKPLIQDWILAACDSAHGQPCRSLHRHRRTREVISLITKHLISVPELALMPRMRTPAPHSSARPEDLTRFLLAMLSTQGEESCIKVTICVPERSLPRLSSFLGPVLATFCGRPLSLSY